jgi:hypothetical protein
VGINCVTSRQSQEINEPDRETFLSQQRQDRLWGPPNLLSNWYRVLFPGVKRPKSEAERYPPSNDEVKNGGNITPLPHTSS